MPHPIFRIRAGDSEESGNALRRPEGTDLRIAHVSDFHVPGDRPIQKRLRDVWTQYGSMKDVSFEVSALSNEFGHPFFNRRRQYTNLIKKCLLGLHRLDIDFLVITGDISHCGVPTEFAEFKGALKVTDWFDKSRFSLVAGNHDRFNLYEDQYERGINDYFDVVKPNEPRFRGIGDEIGLIELDTNRADEDPQLESELWLPNSTGYLSETELEWTRQRLEEFRGRMILVSMHHHLTQDWYTGEASDYGGLMGPVEGRDKLFKHFDAVDTELRVLHGHRHIVMAPDYTYREYELFCPGAFFLDFCVNLIDITDEKIKTTQIELRR